MSNQESQEEEREVLCSIYDSDECFKEQSPTSFTYRIGEVGEPKSFLVEITWGEGYPDELPTINLDTFYNRHITVESKEALTAALRQEAESFVGSPMTYSLFEFAKERGEELVAVAVDSVTSSEPASTAAPLAAAKKEKKEVMSKRAKRRMADRTNAQGELPRGWNWVDVVKHLSKTGSAPQS